MGQIERSGEKFSASRDGGSHLHLVSKRIPTHKEVADEIWPEIAARHRQELKEDLASRGQA